MSKNYSKQTRFADLANRSNVIEWQDADAKDRLNKLLNNSEKVILELACGYGEYTVALAKSNPENTYIGIDIKGERIWKGSKKALKNNITNAYFLRIKIEHIDQYLPKNSVDEIWFTFPDPHPKKKKAKHRITNMVFLNKYKKILKKGGICHLKTDSTVLYVSTIEEVKKFGGIIIEKHPKITPETLENNKILNIETRYERRARKRNTPIKYIKFKV